MYLLDLETFATFDQTDIFLLKVSNGNIKKCVKYV